MVKKNGLVQVLNDRVEETSVANVDQALGMGEMERKNERERERCLCVYVCVCGGGGGGVHVSYLPVVNLVTPVLGGQTLTVLL